MTYCSGDQSLVDSAWGHCGSPLRAPLWDTEVKGLMTMPCPALMAALSRSWPSLWALASALCRLKGLACSCARSPASKRRYVLPQTAVHRAACVPGTECKAVPPPQCLWPWARPHGQQQAGGLAVCPWGALGVPAGCSGPPPAPQPGCPPARRR